MITKYNYLTNKEFLAIADDERRHNDIIEELCQRLESPENDAYLEEQIADLEKELDRANCTIEDLEYEIEGLNEEIADLSSQLEEDNV